MKSIDFLNKILLVNKPEGLTSFQVVNKLKRMLNIKKIGHSGTLDKSATGLLVIGTGYATKLLHYLLLSDKAYVGTVKLGIVTDTCDKDGEVIETRSVKNISPGKIEKVVNSFKGFIDQFPPRYSALKINGKRASDLVREGKQVDLKSRKIEIKNINVENINEENETFDIIVECSKGTYIRSLARDIGEKLETGACLIALCRDKLGNFNLENAVTLEELESIISGEQTDKKFCYSPTETLSFLNKITLTGEGVARAKNGQFFTESQIVKRELEKDVPYIVVDEEENLVAIADIDIDNWYVKYLNVFNT